MFMLLSIDIPSGTLLHSIFYVEATACVIVFVKSKDTCYTYMNLLHCVMSPEFLNVLYSK